MSIEPLKEQARAHEQKEEWDKAVALYKKAIAKLEKDEQPDIGLYNRVADLQVRQGQLDDAADYYEKSIDLYVESELPNNAIAVCKKIVRNMPMRHTVYLKMGQIRGRQGFLSEARQNFLTYAERMQTAGNIDEGLRALGELADLAPEDVEIRLAIAGQMQAHGRKDDAIAQLQAGYHAAKERGLGTGPFEAMLKQLGASPGAAPAKAAAAAGDDLGGFGDIELPGATDAQPKAAPAAADAGGFNDILAGSGPKGGKPAKDEEEAAPLPPFDFSAGEEEEEEGAAALPLLGGEEEEDEGEPLPLLGDGFAATKGEVAEAETVELDAAAFGESDERSDDGAPLPELEFGGLSLESPSAPARESAMEEARSETRRAPQPPPPAAQPPRPAAAPEGLAPRPERPSTISAKDPMGHESLAQRGDIQGAMNALGKLIKGSPNDLVLRQKMVDYAERMNNPRAMVEPWLDLAAVYDRMHQHDKAQPYYQHVLSIDPKNARALQGMGQKSTAAAGSDFVDLGSMLLDDDEEKTTRFVVAYEEPSGDEQADFAKMLSQFRAKVAENMGADDVKGHLDLGTAYKEMGLVDEAISEFQLALRASANSLPAYELLGQCFMDKGEPDAAVRTLKRALDAPREVEDELLGIYYWLGRAYQQIGNKGEAREFYDRVFSLDINFGDVTERLRSLR
jgi:tetratricopeptide (TPR) repeat protein